MHSNLNPGGSLVDELTFPSTVEKHDYGSARAYAEEIQKWTQSVRCWMAYQQFTAATWAFHSQQQYSSAIMAAQQQQHSGLRQQGQPQQQRNGVTIRLSLGRLFRSAVAGVPQTIIVQQHTIPSFLRRIAAEAVDSCILFLFKLITVYMLVEFEIIELGQFERILSSESDVQTLIDVTQELFYIELICKLFSALIEPVAGSADRVMVTCLPGVDFRSSLTRAVIKNMLTTFLFPLSTAFYLFNHNRAVYDLAAKTLVVSL
uniref:RDD domain-containing protein n=1 Tax=Globodera rostochiensis TaxID=31243 RepID=A0A914H0V7_GLORO